ncbi:MAG: acetyl-CoA carboxylase biotin carboxylase subunit [Pseudomonadota bacterium]
MFDKILIANRGEIACRVIRTARRLGIHTVAVYSEADQHALHVALADEAVPIGPAPARDSYLRGDKIIDAARRTGAQAIHPGYGFLSENAAFAGACAAAGIAFIGPPPDAIAAMGSKSAAKRLMEAAGVPLVPGYHGEAQDDATLRAAADAMGYPVLLKAVAGGGGKGMRVVTGAAEFAEALAAARREAQSSFGDDAMLVEKYLTRPRHVEIQVFCDAHDHAVYLFERDCSLQRRHQKVIEEAPAPGLSPVVRTQMGEAAVTAARAIGYRGAGTVEFLLDTDDAFYFMEMNTRLQVEHPVTEMITGQDLVEWQLRVAAGEPLPLAQDQLEIRGHAFEARIYAEDPDQDFLPATGTLAFLQPPEESAHVRVDTGVLQGDAISVHYDPMIAKLIVWDEDRDRALNRLARALRDYRIAGTTTNVEFLYNLISVPAFRAADLDTGFIERHREQIFRSRDSEDPGLVALAALYLLLRRELAAGAIAATTVDPWSPWHSARGWRCNEPATQELRLELDGRELRITAGGEGEHFLLHSELGQARVSGRLDGDILHASLDGHRQSVTVTSHDGGHSLFTRDGALHFREAALAAGGQEAEDEGALTAPMNGTVIAVRAVPGARVARGEVLLVLEAMKMEHSIRAPADGVVAEIFYAEGDLVDGGAELVRFEPAGD